jgi:4-amino-4-deoxy-L-arabinose transferase-like glycosyltransferase
LEKKAVSVIIFGIALVIQLLTFPPWDSLTYDGALYIDIARNLVHNPANFTYQGTYVMYRPPLYPYTLSIFYHFVSAPLTQLTVARLVSMFFFALTAVLVYLIALEMGWEEYLAVLATLFFIINPLSFTMGSRELVHSEFTFFYTLAVYLLYTGRKGKNGTLLKLAFISAGLAILTRYTGLSIIGVFIIYLWLVDYWDWVREKDYWLGMGLLILILFPWLYLGYLHYGGFFKPFEIASRTVTADNPVSAFTYLKWLRKDMGLVLFALLSLGLLRVQENEEGWLILSWFGVGLAGILTVTHKETRFVTFLTPVMAILVVEGIELILDAVQTLSGLRLNDRRKYLALFLAFILIIPVSVSALHLKERWSVTGKYDSHVLRYTSENYPAERLLVSPYLYTMAGFYYPNAKVEMILYRKDVEKKVEEGYYDVIIHKDPNTYLNILTSGNYVLVKEFYGGRFKVFIAKRFITKESSIHQ